LKKAIAENKDEIKSLEEFILSTTNRYEEVSNELESAKETIASSASAKKDLESLTSSINSKKDEILSLNKELNSLQGKIEETGAKSINLSAGHFTVGKDLASGRYKITATGFGGNLSIDDSLGDSVRSISLFSDEEVANATLAAARTVWLSQLSFVLGSLFAGIVGGLVLLGFSTHLELQERIKSHTEQTKYYTQLTKETVEKYIKSQEKL